MFSCHRCCAELQTHAHADTHQQWYSPLIFACFQPCDGCSIKSSAVIVVKTCLRNVAFLLSRLDSAGSCLCVPGEECQEWQRCSTDPSHGTQRAINEGLTDARSSY